MSVFRKAIDKYNSFPVQVRASFWFLVCSVLQRGVSILTTPIFSRILDTGDYGQYTVFNSWLDIVSIFVTLRLYLGVFGQGLVKFGEEKDIFASSLQGLTLLLCTIWTGIYLVFRDFWNSLSGLTTVQMLAMLVMIWSTAVFRFWAEAQRTEYKYRALVIITLIVSILKPGLGIFLVLHAEDKATARILGLAIAEFAGYSWLFFVQMRRGKKFCSVKYWKYAVMFNIPLIPHYLSQAVLSSSDRIMIRSMVGKSEAGIYGLAYSVSKLLSMVEQALVQTYSPWAYHKLKAGKAGEIGNIGIVMMAGMAVMNLFLIALAPEIIAVFAPPAYYDAIWIIPPVAMSVVCTFAYNLFSTIEFYYEETKQIMIASVIAALLNVILNYIFIPIFGYYAAGYTTLFCYMVYSFIHYVFMRRISDRFLGGIEVYSAGKILRLSMLFLCAGFVLLLSYNNRLLRYFLLLCLTGFAFIRRKEIRENIETTLKMRKETKKQKQSPSDREGQEEARTEKDE